MRNINIKRASALLLCTIMLAAGTLTSCLDVESDRQSFDPELDSKTDSVFYALGIAQAMQQLADQYFYQGEMRGELVATTQYTDSALAQLKDFSAGLSNKYDSAYVYYRVINNCNYYIEHRNMELYTGSQQVTIPEYAAILAMRAWAYLQLCRNYGAVPFFTEPLTTISQIDNNSFPIYDIRQVTDALAPELSQYTKINTPDYGTLNIGSVNGTNSSKYIYTRNIFIPVGVILGDLYLESAQTPSDYEKAARSYADYLITTKTISRSIEASFKKRNEELADRTSPENHASDKKYDDIFQAMTTAADATGATDIISIIPMAVNKVNGKVTNVPASFGYDYYALNSQSKWNKEIPLIPSKVYKDLTDNLTYYYKYRAGSASKTDGYNDIKAYNYGDMRSLAIMRTSEGTTTLDEVTEDINWINKFQSGNIILYRVTTVYLHLCEALNRMGMPDLAFELMKDGIGSITFRQPWITQQSRDFLYSTFCDTTSTTFDVFYNHTYPIHQHGAGAVSDCVRSSNPDGTLSSRDYVGSSPYQYGTEITKKAEELVNYNPALCPSGFDVRLANSNRYNQALEDYKTAVEEDENAGEPLPSVDRNLYEPILTKEDSIFVMEELLCDEEAMEFCFEGTRWYDLMRFARHKNTAGLPGNVWLADKVKANNPTKDLTNQQNWYLPFKK